MVYPVSVRDIPDVAALYHRIWHETHGSHMPWAEREARDEGFFLDRVASLMPNVIVAELGGEFVGFAAWNGARLGQLFLDAAVRGSGLAQCLLGSAERGLRDQGIHEAELHCIVGNERARRFYERLGWRVRAIMAEAVKGDTGFEPRDFWVMRKRIAWHV